MHAHERICPRHHRALELLSRRWTGHVLRVLKDGPHRFSDMRRGVEGVSDSVLSERLKEMEAEGLVERRVYSETPVRIEYALTEKGRGLQRIVEDIHRWADLWIPDPTGECAHRHATR